MEEYRKPVIIAKVLANQFQELSKNFRSPIKESNPRINYRKAVCNENIIDFLVRIKNSADHGRCDIKTFKEQIIEMNNSKLLSIEIWWYLKKCGIMMEEDFYLMFDSCDCQHIANYFSECLCRFVFQESECSPFRKKMNSDWIEILLNHKERCDIRSLESHVYHNFLNLLSSCCNRDNRQGIISTDVIMEILEVASVKDSIIKLFLLDLIKVFLNSGSVMPEAAMYNIEQFTMNENLIIKNNLKIFHVLDSQDIISILNEIFISSSKPMNWKNIIYLLSCMISHCEENLKHLKALILFLLNGALESLDKTTLFYVFILARHCSFPKVPDVPSYLNWFSSTFSTESSRPINTREKALFFMNFLTETVEYDPPYYLKVHINRAPCVPMDCQSLVSDYVKLVKTRLVDLDESAELGLFDNVSTKTSAVFDVETVLKIFSNNNEVPKCVLEASLFCRSYYEKKFLVTLLSKYEGASSVRHKLITKLHSLGKIPKSLFLNYKHLI